MEQERVIKGVMLDFNTRFPLVEEEQKVYIRYLFNLVWVAGWEHRSKVMGGHNPKPVAQYSVKDNTLVEIHLSVAKAAKKTKYGYDALLHRIDKDKTTHRGRFYWRYVKSVEGVSKVEQENGLLNSEIIPETKVDILPPSHT